ncbi:hypothetical protein SKAU_G00348870 [Synaphobranchus kaupii]|uniref:Uncharacterized protein n=1 Tax=Synaphobranchus kaupii TaxID=118154 RepID=A0A9Q1EK58_SYNKA|nr:hypothetical protein SKAU_G00348870 [Synaphobranchus kaupii]
MNIRALTFPHYRGKEQQAKRAAVIVLAAAVRVMDSADVSAGKRPRRIRRDGSPRKSQSVSYAGRTSVSGNRCRLPDVLESAVLPSAGRAGAQPGLIEHHQGESDLPSPSKVCKKKGGDVSGLLSSGWRK